MIDDRVQPITPEPLPVVLIPATPADEEFLLKVYASTREDELALVDWPQQAKDDFCAMQFRMQFADYQARYPDSSHDIILFDARPAGRIWVDRDTDEIRLVDIAILPEFRNSGIGKHLLEALIAESAAAGKPLRHMVFKFNQDALRFYERLGFNITNDTGMHFLMERLPGDEPSPATSPDD
ncbi:MAG: GNAT family N-acetyltransferase [Armatimonadota bacterium]